MNQFTCKKCNNTFNNEWSEEEVESEFSKAAWNVPGDGSVDPVEKTPEVVVQNQPSFHKCFRGLLCDDCFQEFKTWFQSLTPEQHKQIKQNISS